MKQKIKGYYFITDSALSRNGIVEDVLCALDAGVRIIQYREKNLSTRKMYDEALKLKKCIKKSLFIINDRIDIAIAVCADGVHIGQEDLPVSITRRIMGKHKIIGVTVHNLNEAVKAESHGADYVAVAPIFYTRTKVDAQLPVGLNVLDKIKKAVSIPVVGIGGITIKNAPDVIKAGADAICSISDVLNATDVFFRIKQFQNLFKKNSNNNLR
ncbi:MAG TPA: thiamine phosphate synthase [bacterium]|nr:thiamine phosphate synthase [bacterium]